MLNPGENGSLPSSPDACLGLGWGVGKQAAEVEGFISLALCMELISLTGCRAGERKIAFEYRK